MGKINHILKKKFSTQILDDVLSKLKGKDGFDDELIEKLRRLIAAGFVSSPDQVIKLLTITSGEANEDY